MPVAEQTAERFYSGYDTGWGCITQRLDARRKVTDDLLYKALLENEAASDPVFILLKGPAGAGKTIALKRAAFDAATASDAVVFWLEESGQLRSDVFIEIADLIRQPIYLFVDQIALHVENLIPFLAAMKEKHVPLIVIGAEREADWVTYCRGLQVLMPPYNMRVGALASSEIEVLLDLLERHNCLGELKLKTHEERVAAFASQEHADRQLLVALHVLTRGLPFEKIVLDEYLSVSSEQAQRLYLDIASLNQFGVSVRAGTISRISGIDFEEYQAKFFGPLIDMVSVGHDPYTGDATYKTRHIHVAQILFRQVFDTDAAKVAQFVRLIEGLDVGYSSDSRVLEGICKGRTLTMNFNDSNEVREIYKAATTAAPNQAYLFQQWAIFESTHPKGDFLEAEFHAETAAWMQPKNSTFVHTQAEVARKRAAMETSQVLKEQLRRKVRAFLEDMPKIDRFRASTRCKLLVDEVKDISEDLGDTEKSAQDQLFSEKLNDAEVAILKAQQEFPDDAEMFEIEARLWGDLKEKGKALRALERAWAKSPRGAGTVVRLGKMYAAAGRGEDRLRVLREALAKDSDNKAAHYALALHYLEENPPSFSEAETHLARCASIDNRDFEVKYMLAQIYFARGNIGSAVELFSEIHAKAPKTFRTRAPREDNVITKTLESYTGSVETVRGNYVLIRSGAYPNPVFAPIDAFPDDDVAEVTVGVGLEFKIRFSRRGPVAADITVKQLR
jgi:tetratricopeptide (TPR) repeat protein